MSLPEYGHSSYGNGYNKTYYLGMIVDADNDVSESNESNNRNLGPGIDRDEVLITLPVGDLAVTIQNIDGTPTPLPVVMVKLCYMIRATNI